MVHDFNDLNVFVIACFFLLLLLLLLNPSAYDNLLGSSFCIIQALSMYFPFVLIQAL